MKRIVLLFILALFPFISVANAKTTTLPQLFLFVDEDSNLTPYKEILANPCVTGVQILYSWRELEPKKGVYDFSRIERDLNFLTSMHKKLFIQLQDRSFEPNIYYVPDYILKDKEYHGGVAMQYDFPGEGMPITEGWVARVWDKNVQQRFILLMKNLATQFDGKIYGINLPETAVDFDPKAPPKGFTPHNYFTAEIENITALRAAFSKSIVIQYVNFFPGEWNNDQGYMAKLFSYAAKNNIGLGGPDVVPYRKSQMKNSYPFFHQYNNKIIPIGMAVQKADYSYTVPGTKQHYDFSAFYSFAKDYLGTTILFWNIEEPFFSKELTPMINKEHFVCMNGK